MQLLHSILQYAHWLIVAIFIGEYAWRVLIRRSGEAWPGQLQLMVLIVAVLLALQMNDRGYLDELSGTALNWRMFWHVLKFLGLASALFWILFARYRLRLELGRPELN